MYAGTTLHSQCGCGVPRTHDDFGKMWRPDTKARWLKLKVRTRLLVWPQNVPSMPYLGDLDSAESLRRSACGEGMRESRLLALCNDMSFLAYFAGHCCAVFHALVCLPCACENQGWYFEAEWL